MAVLLVAPAARAAPPPLTVNYTATDVSNINHQWYVSGTTTTSSTLATTGSVTFAYPTGSAFPTRHNVNFTSALKPTSCQLGANPAAAPPLPSPAAVAPWTVTCRFDTPGTYTFNCQIHPTMVGTINVTGDSVATGPGGSVPATLSLGIGSQTSLGSFILGVAQDYTATVDAVVTETAADARLSVADPSSTAPGHLVNGTYVMAQALQVKATNAANPNTVFAPVPGAANPLTLLTWNGPVSNDAITVSFKQPVAATDPLRTGSYAKTLQFTLSTTSP